MRISFSVLTAMLILTAKLKRFPEINIMTL